MTALEYINDITKRGTFVLLQKKMVNEHVESVGDGNGSYTKATLFRGETPDEYKDREHMVEAITTCAINCDPEDIRLFYDHVFMLLPKKAQQGTFDEEGLSELVRHILLSARMKLTEMVIQERFQKSANVLLTILQSRIKEWQKKAVVNGKSELDKEGKPTGNFTFIVKGDIL